MARPPTPSFRHARLGLVGVEGQLPAGWAVERAESVSVENISGGPSIQLEVRFGDAEYTSIVTGSFVHPRPGDIYLAKAEISFAGSDNIAACFIVVREWVENGACVGQVTRTVGVGDRPETAVVGLVPERGDRLLQPVIAIKRASPLPAVARIIIRSPILASLYQYPDWLADPDQALDARSQTP